MALGTVLQVYTELQEIRNVNRGGPKRYFKDLQNIFQWGMVAVNVALIFQALAIAGLINNSKNTQDHVIRVMRVNMIISIILCLLELFSRVRIFDFFAYFVRQLNEIVYDALPLGTMLAFIVMAQTLLFWILDMNSNEPTYEGMDGFGRCMIDSYRLALGDFEIAESFDDNMRHEAIFWTIFFIGTLVSLLIILNMVIAVMGGTFERVQEQTEAYILRERLRLILENLHRMPDSVLKRLASFKYLLSIDVDPEVDPIAQDSVETRLAENIDGLKASMVAQTTRIDRVQLNLDNLYSRLLSDEKNTVKNTVMRVIDDAKSSDEDEDDD